MKRSARVRGRGGRTTPLSRRSRCCCRSARARATRGACRNCRSRDERVDTMTTCAGVQVHAKSQRFRRQKWFQKRRTPTNPSRAGLWRWRCRSVTEAAEFSQNGKSVSIKGPSHRMVNDTAGHLVMMLSMGIARESQFRKALVKREPH